MFKYQARNQLDELGNAVATGATRVACNAAVGSIVNNAESLGECCMVGNFTHGDCAVASYWNMYIEPDRKRRGSICCIRRKISGLVSASC